MTKRKRSKTKELESNSFSHDDDNDHKSSSRVPNLPMEIIFKILNWGSAKFLHNVGKLVCKSWATTIYSPLFIDKHLSHSIPILFFRDPEDYDCIFYVEFRIKRLRDFNFVERKLEEFVLDSSVGLVLNDNLKLETLMLRNSITGQFSKLPYPPFGNTGSMCRMNVAYLSRTGEVKVICSDRSLQPTIPCLWCILTVGAHGNTSWRMLNNTNTGILDIVPSITGYESFFSSTVGGVVIYWTSNLVNMRAFIAVDLHDESFHLVHVPSICDEDTFWEFIPMGKELYVISVKRDYESLCSEDNRLRIWKMGDFRQSEWMESYTVKVDEELESILYDRFVRFIAWYKNHKILVYITSNDRIMAYKFKVGKSYFITNSFDRLKHNDFWLHTNSLVRW